MKKILSIFLTLFFFSCAEDEIQPQINFDSPYELKDDPADPVNHKRFLLFQEYGVPIFFSDTVNRVYITKNIQGDSVFKNEMLDLNWGFTSMGTIPYSFSYLQKAEERLQALENIELYLKNSLPSLRPFSIFLVNEFPTNLGAEVLSMEDLNAAVPRNTVSTFTTYRTLVVAQAHKSFSADFWKKYAVALLKTQVQKAIADEKFKAKLLEFQTIAPAEHYDTYWVTLGADATGFTPASWRTFDYNLSYTGALAATYDKIIDVFGTFGFIGFSNTWGIWYSPNLQVDRNQYIDALFTHNTETFERVWSEYPLVMQKYGMLRDIIVNDMAIPLDEIVQ